MAAGRAARTWTGERLRLLIVVVGALLAWGGLGYQLFQVQVVRADEFREQSLDQRQTRQTLTPSRGKIFDRTGQPLAMTIEAQSIYAVPDLVENPVYTAQTIGSITGEDWAPLLGRLEAGGSFAYMARQLEPAMAREILDLNLPGIAALPEPKRVYPHGVIASQVVGLVGLEGAGQEGLELVYDDLLTGTAGEVVFERDTRGRSIPQAPREVVAAVPGEDLISTIDLSLQYFGYDTCEQTLERTGASGCWIVALHVETGEVLALVGAPGFDPEERVGLGERPEDKAYNNFAVRGTYEPGSTQKLITLAAALDSDSVEVDTVIPSVGDRYETTEGACESRDDDVYGCFNDFDEHETRDMTVSEIFTMSSNVGTIKIQERLADDVLGEYMNRFGLGQPTGIDYNGEAWGAVSLDNGCSSCLASAAIGYSVAVSPLQMAAAYAAIGNDGVWTEPYLVRSMADVDGNVEEVNPDTRRVVSEGTSWAVRQLLAKVVSEGTGYAAAVEGYEIGGKTGTANKLVDGVYVEETMASFVGMAPIDDPKVVIAVVVDNPAWEFRTGGLAAAPAFSEMMEAALNSLGVAPDGSAR